MALSGINLAPAFAGQEAVWQRVRTGAEGGGTGRASEPEPTRWRWRDLWNREPWDRLTPGARCRFTVIWG